MFVTFNKKVYSKVEFFPQTFKNTDMIEGKVCIFKLKMREYFELFLVSLSFLPHLV